MSFRHGAKALGPEATAIDDDSRKDVPVRLIAWIPGSRLALRPE
jgi:hypothetical protein